MAARTRWQIRAARGLTKFVGRQREIDLLAPALERAGAGQGQVVAIVGEPGLGKSRLVHEFVRSEPARDWLVHETGAVPHGGNTAYLPVSNLLRSVLAVEAGDSPAEIAQKLR